MRKKQADAAISDEPEPISDRCHVPCSNPHNFPGIDKRQGQLVRQHCRQGFFHPRLGHTALGQKARSRSNGTWPERTPGRH